MTSETNDAAADNQETPEPSMFRYIFIVALPFLLVVAGFLAVGYYLSEKDSQLDRDGIVTTAEIYDVTKDQLGSALETGGGSRYNDRDDHYTIHYQFVTESGEKIQSSFNRETMSPPEIGTTLEVRYAIADPTVHETAVGHTKSQVSALLWIGLFFLMLFLGMLLWNIIAPVFRRTHSTREKRLKRMEELSGNK